MRAGRNKADAAGRLSAGLVPRAEDEQPGEFARAAGVGLERSGRKAGDFGEPAFEILEEALVPFGLPRRSEVMGPAKLGPGERQHLGAGVEFHRARAEGNHARGERQVARFQPPDVAQHLRLAVMKIERGMAQEGRRASKRRREFRLRAS